MKLRPHRLAQRGQALLETAIIIPIMVFVVLGALQLVLIQHGRVMTEYAAYNAARAGVVHNGNWNVMRNAAMISSLPLYARTDSLAKLMGTWAEVKAAAEITEAVDTGAATLERLAGDLLGVEISGIAQDVSLIEVEVTHPNAETFNRAAGWQRDREDSLRYPDGEIDFDDLAMLQQHRELARLAVNVRVLVPLKIPVVNKIFFELWLAQNLLRSQRVHSDLIEWAQMRGRLEDGRFLDEAVQQADGQGPLDDFFAESQWIKEIRTLRWVAERFDLYLIPIRASYAMQMQSNVFANNRREPVWFSIDD